MTRAQEITNAVQALAAAQARYEITLDRMTRNLEGVDWDIRPTTYEIEVAKERLNHLLQETP